MHSETARAREQTPKFPLGQTVITEWDRPVTTALLPEDY
jgi:hypothetical protein